MNVKNIFPFNLIYRPTTASIMGQFTRVVDELDAVANREMNAATAASDRAEEIYDNAVYKAELAREEAERIHQEVISRIDEKEEAGITSAEIEDAKWEAHTAEMWSAREASNKMRSFLGMEDV